MECRGGVSPMIEPARRVALLAAARAALQGGEPSPAGDDSSPEGGSGPSSPVSVFVTLRRLGELRGCIGVLEDPGPLEQAVGRCAVSASRDPRFPPLREEEWPEVRIEISVLGGWRPVAGPEEIVTGRDGLLVTQALHRGLLLPQVATEQGWDATRFLEQACAKAGLPPGAWCRGARVQAFSAEVFSEAGPEEELPAT